MTLESVQAWIMVGGELIRRMMPDDKGKDKRTPEEQITEAGQNVGIKTPRIF